MTLRAILREALAQRLARGESRTFAKAEMRGLPMDEASRMARAREQGFDTETPLYHGTGADFPAFEANDGISGRGVYLTDDPGVAEIYTPNRVGFPDREFQEGANIIPVFARNAEVLPLGNRLVADPADVRSIFAAFDPHNTNRANLLGGFAVGAPIGALTLREALRERAQS